MSFETNQKSKGYLHLPKKKSKVTPINNGKQMFYLILSWQTKTTIDLNMAQTPHILWQADYFGYSLNGIFMAIYAMCVGVSAFVGKQKTMQSSAACFVSYLSWKKKSGRPKNKGILLSSSIVSYYCLACMLWNENNNNKTKIYCGKFSHFQLLLLFRLFLHTCIHTFAYPSKLSLHSDVLFWGERK